jgi:hypothetical protein
MVTMDDLAKKKAGASQLGNQEPQKPDPLSELDSAISRIENIEAKELLQAKARQLRAELDLKARESEAKSREYGDRGGSPPPDQKTEREQANAEMRSFALELLSRNVDPKVVAQILMGSGTQQIPVNLGGGTGFTIADVFGMMDRMAARPQADDTIKDAIREMREEIKALREKNGAPPPTPPKVYTVTQDGQVLETPFGAPVVIKTPPPASSGEPIEVVREKNRHEEELEKIKHDKWYKEQLADSLGTIAEGVGSAGLGRMLGGGGGAGAGGRTATGAAFKEFYTCECGEKIPIFPETGDSIKCAKCGQVYNRGGSAQAEVPSAQPRESTKPPETEAE